MVLGSFSLVEEYSSLYEDQESQVYFDLTNGLTSVLDKELYLFGLPGRFESSINRLVNRYTLSLSCHAIDHIIFPHSSSGSIGIEYTVSNYFPRESIKASLSPPTVNTLASVMQTIVRSGWVGPYQIAKNTHSLTGDYI